MRWPWSKTRRVAPLVLDAAAAAPRAGLTPVRAEGGVSWDALAQSARAASSGVENPFAPAKPAPGVLPSGGLAMDYNPLSDGGAMAYSVASYLHEGLGFLGYPYLAELSQRPEYRHAVETIAREMTRKWIKISAKGGKERADDVAKLNALMDQFNVRDLFRKLMEKDGFFGRAQLYIDTGDTGTALSSALLMNKAKFGDGKKLRFKVLEPFWSYPGQYNSNNPLAPDFYVPQVWYVNGATVHASRLLTFVGREMPDILKPAYAFGGLSLTQMGKPYVDNWLRTRQSVSDITHAFSVPVLKTNMTALMSGGVGAVVSAFVNRLQMFNATRDNKGIMAIDKETEDFVIAAAPLGSLDKLQAQSQEQMASVWKIPLVVLLGVTPSGLNASSDGEIRTFYASLKSAQESNMRPGLQVVFEIMQLIAFGKVDPDFSFAFVDLWEMNDTDRAAMRKTEADTDGVYITNGVLAPEEVRERIANDDEGIYTGLDLSGPPPEPPELPDPDKPPGEEDDEPEPDAA